MQQKHHNRIYFNNLSRHSTQNLPTSGPYLSSVIRASHIACSSLRTHRGPGTLRAKRQMTDENKSAHK